MSSSGPVKYDAALRDVLLRLRLLLAVLEQPAAGPLSRLRGTKKEALVAPECPQAGCNPSWRKSSRSSHRRRARRAGRCSVWDSLGIAGEKVAVHRISGLGSAAANACFIDVDIMTFLTTSVSSGRLLPPFRVSVGCVEFFGC